MNTLQMYSVFDTKSELFTAPHFMQSHGVAIRSFSSACEDENTQFNKYPSDFNLYHVGEFNIETGEITSVIPKQICNASEFVNANKVTQPELTEFAEKHIEKLDAQLQN
jgi:hypothetical protein